MNYELAKQLKDAGFKSNQDWPVYAEDNKTVKEWLPHPTLEELMEACGTNFFCLEREAEDEDARVFWLAFAEDNPIGSPVGSAFTPIEAVAKLWLALNTKS